MCQHDKNDLIRLPNGLSFCNICKIKTEQNLFNIYSYIREIIFVIASFNKRNYCCHHVNYFKKHSILSPIWTCSICENKLITNTESLYLNLNNLINEIAYKMDN
jgi:ribosomal protein L37AE/L43A